MENLTVASVCARLSGGGALAALGALARGCDDAVGAAGDGGGKPDGGDGDADAGPAGACFAERSNDTAPDYDVVFPRDAVLRIDIAIAPDDFAAMQADLDDLIAGDDGGPPPPAAFDACGGVAIGEPCEYASGGATVTGACVPDMGDPEAGVCIDRGGDDARDPIYVPATVRFDGCEWPYVGIRYKGNSSLRYSYEAGVQKLPFRLQFDEFEDAHPETQDQRFFGFKEFGFAPGYYDSSYLHDTLAAEIFAAHGVPVARTSFYEVQVDVGQGDVYWGLYTAIEDPSDAMLDRVWGDDSGNLYESEGPPCGDWTCFDEASFVKKNNEESDWADVQAAIEALGSGAGDDWRAGLDASFDVAGFLRFLAVSTVIVNPDSYGLSPRNYYLYGAPADGGRLAWIPWDHNMTLAEYRMMGQLSLTFDEVGDEWPLIRRPIDDPVYAGAYREALAATLDGPLEIEPFAARAQALHDLIAPSVEAESAPYTQLRDPAEFASSVDDLVAHVAARREAVEAVLAAE